MVVPRAQVTRKHALYTRPHRSVLQLQPQPTIINQDGTKTLRLRQHGNPSLPMPPLMDPIAIEARARHTNPKPDAEADEMTAFQRELAMNPHAQALATPVRQCALTKARLPSHFLQPFCTTISHPSTSDEISPTRRKLQPVVTPGLASSAHNSDTSTGSSSYIVNNRWILDVLSEKNTWRSIVTLRMIEAFAKEVGRKNVKVAEEWVWDKDMSEKVREQLVEEVTKRLNPCLEDDTLTSAISSETDASNDSHYAAVLDASLTATPMELPLSGDKIPIYHLKELLGPEILSSLPLHPKADISPYLGVIQHPRNMKLLLALDRLDMYTKAHDVPT